MTSDAHELPGGDVLSAGLRWHVARYGAGLGEPLVLLHGPLTTSNLWHDVARDLGPRRRVVAPDLLGLGRSERPGPHRRPGLDRVAAELLTLLDTLGIERCALAGHDLGGAVALHAAALAPDRTSALILIDSPAHADVWPPVEYLPWLVPGLHRLWDRSAHSAGVGHWVRAVDLVPVEAALGLVAQNPPPVLILWGGEDRVYRLPYARRLAAALPGSTLVVVPHAGHALPQDRPERLAEEIDGFLVDVEAPSSL